MSLFAQSPVAAGPAFSKVYDPQDAITEVTMEREGLDEPLTAEQPNVFIQTGPVTDNARGILYARARRAALNDTAGNADLQAIISKQVYKERRPAPAKVYAKEDMVNEFKDSIPKNFFEQLRANNEEVFNIVSTNVFKKKSGGVSIRLPSTKGLQGTTKDDTQYARRILRILRGVQQGKTLKGAAYNTQLLAGKKALANMKKLADPHAYVVQLRSYQKKYGTTVPAQVKAQGKAKINEGLKKAAVLINSKLTEGVDRAQSFPQTSTVQNRAILSQARKDLNIKLTSLGLGGSVGQSANIVPWESFNV